MQNKNLRKNINNEETIHVMLNEPILLRKLILKAAIESVKLQHNYSELKSLQELQTKHFKKLSGIHKEIKVLEKNLENSDMPKVSEEYKDVLEEIEDSMNESLNVKEDPNIERLKKELEEIEKKLMVL